MKLQGYQTAVIDWGIGGLSVYREIKRRSPRHRIAYVSDSGFTPYGKLKPADLTRRLVEVCGHLNAQGIREVVIACNAASTAAPTLRRRLPAEIRIVDVISNGIRLVEKTRHRRVGVIGGRRTITSRVYQSSLKGRRREVVGRIAQPLSALIERGELDSPLMHSTLREILTPLRSVDALVLACTHYPAVAGLIAKFMPGVALLNPAAMTAEDLLNAPAGRGKRGDLKTPTFDLFTTTGDTAASNRAAELAFHLPDIRFKKFSQFI